jgi:hypothetical protein
MNYLFLRRVKRRLPGTEMTVLFPGRMDKKQMGAKRKILIPMMGRS